MNLNNKKVVTVLVWHFSNLYQKIVVNHLSSFVVVKVTSEKLFENLDTLFSSHDIPWSNLVSVLMDSCRVMHGEKAGLEALIRSRRAPHMLDVDDDTMLPKYLALNLTGMSGVLTVFAHHRFANQSDGGRIIPSSLFARLANQYFGINEQSVTNKSFRNTRLFCWYITL